MPPTFIRVDHPLVSHKLTLMRDKETKTTQFNNLLRETAMLMAYEVTRTFETESKSINTHFQDSYNGQQLKGKKSILVPVLRAGLVMCEGIRAVTASSRMGHIGLYKDRTNDELLEYLVAIPQIEDRYFILVDPLIATGRTARHAIQILLDRGIESDRILFVSLIITTQAEEFLSKQFAKVAVNYCGIGIRIYYAAKDDELTQDKRVKPGVGYIGKRLFGEL